MKQRSLLWGFGFAMALVTLSCGDDSDDDDSDGGSGGSAGSSSAGKGGRRGQWWERRNATAERDLRPRSGHGVPERERLRRGGERRRARLGAELWPRLSRRRRSGNLRRLRIVDETEISA